jgi:hypothetical protein
VPEIENQDTGNTPEGEALTRFVDLLSYSAIIARNRETFLLNYGEEFRLFDSALRNLQMTWIRVTRRRQKRETHVGLLLPAGLLIRHALLGFQQIVSYQSFLAWLAFRPGLEALLILASGLTIPRAPKSGGKRISIRASTTNCSQVLVCRPTRCRIALNSEACSAA